MKIREFLQNNLQSGQSGISNVCSPQPPPLSGCVTVLCKLLLVVLMPAFLMPTITY